MVEASDLSESKGIRRTARTVKKGKREREKSRAAMQAALELISPGTDLREAIYAILQSGNGALICIGNPKKLAELSEAGVAINTPYTPQLLYELSKMDGAIILNDDATKICFANRFLKADTSIPSDETGTRHRSAERIARKAKCMVVAVSERRSSVTLYVHNERHVLESIATLLNKSTQALNTLEKYVRSLEQAMADLTVREFEDIVTIFDLCKTVQRFEMARRVAEDIKPYIVELGVEGRLVGMQLEELVIPFEEALLVVKDYCKKKGGRDYDNALKALADLPREDVLNLSNVSQALGFNANLKSIDTYLSPRGFRVLTQTRRLPPAVIENLVEHFGTFQQIVRAPKEELVEIEGVGDVLAERIRLSLNSLMSQLALDRSRR
jgi:diadenylate cyclase